jgi:hypothetical protein
MNLSYIPFDDSVSSSNPPSPHLSRLPASSLPPISKVLLNHAIQMELNIGIIINILPQLDYSLPEDQLINLLLDRYASSSLLLINNIDSHQLRFSFSSINNPSVPPQPNLNRSGSWHVDSNPPNKSPYSQNLRNSPKKELHQLHGRNLDRNLNDSMPKSRGKNPREQIKTCDICLERKEKIARLTCGHSFCEDCLLGYLENRIGGGVVEIICPESECGKRIEETEIIGWIWRKRELILKYERFKRNRRIEKDPNLRFCSRPGCNEIVSKNIRDDFGRCTCGEELCFLCGNKAHPVLLYF